MKNFEMLQKVCIDEVLGAGIEPGNIVSWVINRRAKRDGECARKIRMEHALYRLRPG